MESNLYSSQVCLLMPTTGLQVSLITDKFAALAIFEIVSCEHPIIS
jgi:hypothetical protein